MQPHTLSRQTVSTNFDDLGQTSVEGVGESNMTYHTAFEKGKRSHTFGAINDLVRNDKISRLNLLLQTADRGKGNDGPDTQMSQCRDVGSVAYLMRRKFVMKTMARDESDSNWLSAAGRGVVKDTDRRRGLAPGRLDVQARDMCKACKRLQSSAANDSNRDWLYKVGLVSAGEPRNHSVVPE